MSIVPVNARSTSPWSMKCPYYEYRLKFSLLYARVKTVEMALRERVLPSLAGGGTREAGPRRGRARVPGSASTTPR
ncbi:hypothetical protein HBB16_04730 [Pseudonocardia sp. MCCB 268]|nr:hypothetical protein [Pseudonocardia cytotoxica]